MSDSIFDSKYKFIRELGRGGCGTVLLAENIMLGNVWAVKKIPKNRETSISAHIEPLVLKRLNHPALPRICDVYDEDDYVYIVEDYIEGETLKHFLDTQGALSPERVLNIGLQLLNVLNYLHKLKPQPVIYRDLKPHNIIITKEDYIKLIDFGVSAVLNEKNLSSDTIFIGTRGYSAPEVYNGNIPDCTADIYSFGITIFVLLTQNEPEEIAQLHQNIDNCIPHARELAQRLLNIARICTQKAKEQRYQSIDEILEAFKEIEVSMSPRDHVTSLSAIKTHAKGSPAIIGIWGARATGVSTLAYSLCELSVKHGYKTCYLDLSLNGKIQVSSNISFKNASVDLSGYVKNDQNEAIWETVLGRASAGFDYVTFNNTAAIVEADSKSELQISTALSKELLKLRSNYTVIVVDCSYSAFNIIRQYIYYEIIVSDMNPYNIRQIRDNISKESLKLLVINKYYDDYLPLTAITQLLGSDLIDRKILSIPYVKELYLGMCRSYLGENINTLKIKNAAFQQSLNNIWDIILYSHPKKSLVNRIFNKAR